MENSFNAQVHFSTEMNLQFFKVSGFNAEQRVDLLSYLSFELNGINGNVHFLKSGAIDFVTESPEQFGRVTLAIATLGCKITVSHNKE